ncbi:MAG: acylphosphatase [Planctomycetota bacterium]
MTVSSLLVPKKAEDFSRKITDEAEKYRIRGFVWRASPDELKLVIEGERETVEEFFDYVVDAGSKLRLIASYTKPKWSAATGRYKYFVRIFTPEPPE